MTAQFFVIRSLNYVQVDLPIVSSEPPVDSDETPFQFEVGSMSYDSLDSFVRGESDTLLLSPEMTTITVTRNGSNVVFDDGRFNVVIRNEDCEPLWSQLRRSSSFVPTGVLTFKIVFSPEFGWSNESLTIPVRIRSYVVQIELTGLATITVSVPVSRVSGINTNKVIEIYPRVTGDYGPFLSGAIRELFLPFGIGGGMFMERVDNVYRAAEMTNAIRFSEENGPGTCWADQRDCLMLLDVISRGSQYCNAIFSNMYVAVRPTITDNGNVLQLSQSFGADDRATNPAVEDDESDADPEVDSAELCKVCYARRKTHAMLPCGHFAYCRRCVQRVDVACAVCKIPKITYCKIIDS